MKRLVLIGLLGLFLLSGCEPAPEPEPEAEPDPEAEAALAEEEAAQAARDNPLLQDFYTPFRVPPFHLIESAHFEPAFQATMARNLEEIGEIVDQPEPPDFENTIEALEAAGRDQQRLALIFYALKSAQPGGNLESRAGDLVEMLSRHRDEVLLDQALFERVDQVYRMREELDLDEEQNRLLTETHRAFVRSGSALASGDRERLREINAELARLAQTFSRNLRAENNDFSLHVTRREDVAGLSDGLLYVASRTATERGEDEGWVFTLHGSSFIPFMTHASNRALRQEMFEAWSNRGRRDNGQDNRPVVEVMAALRAERAGLLGFDSHAHMVLDDSMAGGPDEVMTLLDSLWLSASTRAAEEARKLDALVRADGHDDGLQPWDWWFYSEQVRREEFDLEDDELRPYFALEQVTEGAFRLANRLWNLTFHKRTDLPYYHTDVDSYEVKDQLGNHLGVLFLDYLQRDEKQDGAWTSTLRFQSRREDSDSVVMNVASFPRPAAGEPTQLSLDEVLTLFHELGHAFQGLLSDVEYRSLSGTSVPADFVEFPAQLMEHWALEPEMVRQYAYHYETGSLMPDDWIQSLGQARHFGQGTATLQDLAAVHLDLAWHRLGPEENREVDVLEQTLFDDLNLPAHVHPRYTSTVFNPVFERAGGASYFNFLWSDILAADVFSRFRDEGLLNRDLASDLKAEIFAPANSRPPLESYKALMGRAPTVDALLVRRGLGEGE